MIKFKQGWIVNDTTGVKQDIIVKALFPNKTKDIVIGGLLIGLGVAHIAVSAFKNGSLAYEDAEMKVFEDLGLIQD